MNRISAHFKKKIAEIVESEASKEEIYLSLQKIDVKLDDKGGIYKYLNETGLCNSTVCPKCGVDDFIHIEDCEFIVN